MVQKKAYHEKRVLLLLVVVITNLCPLVNSAWAQENGSIGIGTESPNTNAVLELVSPGNNQGLLVPRLTTVQRTSFDFISNLSNIENGLLVFDTDENAFFFWMTDQWIEVGNTQFSAGSGIQITNGIITNTGDDDADPLNEIQTISLSNDSLVLSNGGGSILIDTDNSDEIQTLTFSSDTLFLSDGGAVAIDSSLTNEIQDLSIAGDILTITNNSSATNIDLSGYLDDTDEQHLSLSGTDLSIDNGNTVDLTTLVDDSDADPTNEIQDLSLSASNTLTITGNTSATEIDLSPFSGSNTDNQSLTYDNSSGYTISISNGNTIDISDLKDDNDADPTNEIELPTSASTGEILIYDGEDWVAGTDNVDDADNDATNEIELPSTATTGDILVYDGADWVAGTDNVDDADNDATNEIELPTSATAGDILVFDGSDWVAGTDNVDDGDNDATNELELPSSADNGDVLKYSRGIWTTGNDNVNDNDSDPTNEIELPSTATTGDILVFDGANWVAGTDNVNDSDSDASNELQGLSYNSTSNSLSISTSGSASVNLSELDDTFSSPWDDDGSTVTYNGEYATANNFIARPNSEVIAISSGNNSITREQIKLSKIIQIKGADAANIRAIEPGVDGQQLICIVVDTQAIFVNQDSEAGTSQLVLSANSHTLGAGSTIHLVYNETIGGWLEISYSIAAGRG